MFSVVVALETGHFAHRCIIFGTSILDRGRSAGKVSTKTTRLDDRHLDAQWTNLLGQHFRETLDAPLCGRIGRAAQRSNSAADRRKLDDVARFLLTHHRDCSLGDIDDAKQIGLDLRPEFLKAGVFNGVDIAIARIVDKDIEAPKRIDCVFIAASAAAGSVTSSSNRRTWSP